MALLILSLLHVKVSPFFIEMSGLRQGLLHPRDLGSNAGVALALGSLDFGCHS